MKLLAECWPKFRRKFGWNVGKNSTKFPPNYDTYFLKISNCRFKSMVKPGDTLILKLELLGPMRRGIMEMKGTAFVGDKVVTEAELMAKIQKRN